MGLEMSRGTPVGEATSQHRSLRGVEGREDLSGSGGSGGQVARG